LLNTGGSIGNSWPRDSF